MGLSAGQWLALWNWSDLDPNEKRHLCYPSVWRWFQVEYVPRPFALIANPTEREWRQREYWEPAGKAAVASTAWPEALRLTDPVKRHSTTTAWRCRVLE